MDPIKLVIDVVDAPFVIGIIVVIEILKRTIKLTAKWGKLWSLVMIAFAFGAAYIKMPVFVLKEFIVQGFIYSAASEFVYQGYRTIIDKIRKGKE